MSPSSGSAGGGEETTAPTKTSGEKGGSSSLLRSRRENVKEGESSSTVEENPNREETKESSTAHETGWGGTDENEVLQTGWGDAYVDRSVSQTGWVNSDELQMSSTTHRSGDNSTAQTEHGGSAPQTSLDPVESKYKKQEVKGDADLLGEEVSVSFRAQQFDLCVLTTCLKPKTILNHDIFRLSMWIGQNLRVSILATTRRSMLMIILIETVAVMFHVVAKVNMIVVNVRDTEAKVEEMGLLVGEAVV